MQNQPKSQGYNPREKDIYETIIRNDFRWRMSRTGDLVPIERLPDDHWESIINKWKGDQNFKRLAMQYRATLKHLGIKRSRIEAVPYKY